MLLRTAAAAKLCGVSRFTLWRWTCEDVRVRACMFRRGWYRVDALAEAGLCQMPKPADQATVAA